jgi:DNA segregation ATPase FtsK/SpoIIIE-like protein
MLNVFPKSKILNFEYLSFEMSPMPNSPLLNLLDGSKIAANFFEEYEIKDSKLLIRRKGSSEQNFVVFRTLDGYFMDDEVEASFPSKDAECIYSFVPTLHQSSRNSSTTILDSNDDRVITRVDYNGVVNALSGEILHGHCQTTFGKDFWILEQQMITNKMRYHWIQKPGMP